MSKEVEILIDGLDDGRLLLSRYIGDDPYFINNSSNWSKSMLSVEDTLELDEVLDYNITNKLWEYKLEEKEVMKKTWTDVFKMLSEFEEGKHIIVFKEDDDLSIFESIDEMNEWGVIDLYDCEIAPIHTKSFLEHYGDEWITNMSPDKNMIRGVKYKVDWVNLVITKDEITFKDENNQLCFVYSDNWFVYESSDYISICGRSVEEFLIDWESMKYDIKYKDSESVLIGSDKGNIANMTKIINYNNKEIVDLELVEIKLRYNSENVEIGNTFLHENSDYKIYKVEMKKDSIIHLSPSHNIADGFDIGYEELSANYQKIVVVRISDIL